MGDQRPNFLFLMVDQQRYPVVYENEDLRAWRRNCLKGEEFLKSKGVEFRNHYAGSSACCPSRATLYTGQYPSLHGVSQTDGAAKGAYDPDMFWLNPATVPTFGHYFRAAGYRTYWKGKWHVSAASITIPGTHNAFLTYDPDNGKPIPQNERLYENADVLWNFGFSDWVGPEPHGADPRNSGSSSPLEVSGRDVVYAQETVELIEKLDGEYAASGGNPKEPWFIMCSFVNPHDIAIFGAITQALPLFDFKADPSVPLIPPAPTAAESLLTKPVAQFSYKNIYPYALQPLLDTIVYRRLYYSLQLEADRQVCKVLDALMKSSFYNNTIIIFTSDHGELLGAHGGLFQKWYQAYEETIHVPLIIHSPRLFKEPVAVDLLTSHVDVLPTMLGLAGLNAQSIQETLNKSHTEVRPLVGRDLSPLLNGKKDVTSFEGPIYFMTDDNISKGLDQVSFTGIPYHAVIQPNSVETVIAALPAGEANRRQIWKYSRYFDNPQFWSIPNKTVPVPDQYEMYNITADPLEMKNLVYNGYADIYAGHIRAVLEGLLLEQRSRKRLYPAYGRPHGAVPVLSN